MLEEKNTCIHEKPKKYGKESSKESYRKPNGKKVKQVNMQNEKASEICGSYSSKISIKEFQLIKLITDELIKASLTC